MTTKRCLEIFAKSAYKSKKAVKIAQSEEGPVIITSAVPGETSCNYYLILNDKVVPTYPPLCGLDETTIRSIY